MTQQDKTARSSLPDTDPARDQQGKAAGEADNKPWWRRLLPLAVIVAVMAAIFGSGLHEYLSLKQLAIHLEELRGFIEANYIAAIALFIGVYIAIAALSIPGGLIVTVAGGLLFGWLVGTLATVTGATIGATLLFLAARTSLGEPLKARAGPWLDQFQKGFEKNAFSYLLFLRLVPAFPFWLVNLAPAFLGVPLATYIITTFVGIIPGSLAYAYTGHGLDSVIGQQKETYENCVAEKGESACDFTLDASSLVTTEIIIAFALLSLVALLPVLIKRLRRAQNHA